MEVKILEHTPNPENLVAAAAKLCYSRTDIKSLMNNLTPDKVTEFIEKLETQNHESPFEHVSFTFGIEGVSRALSHQLVRSRIASFSQASQRYQSESGFEYVTPESILKHMPKSEGSPSALYEFRKMMSQAQHNYDILVNMGIPREDARAVLPNACCTRLIMTMNVRELWHWLSLRTCSRAQAEHRELATRILVLLKSECPLLFKHAGPSCVKGFCPEGKMSCGKAPTLDVLLKAHKLAKEREA